MNVSVQRVNRSGKIGVVCVFLYDLKNWSPQRPRKKLKDNIKWVETM